MSPHALLSYRRLVTCDHDQHLGRNPMPLGLVAMEVNAGYDEFTVRRQPLPRSSAATPSNCEHVWTTGSCWAERGVASQLEAAPVRLHVSHNVERLDR